MSYREISAPKLEYVYTAGFKVSSVSDTTTDLTNAISLRSGTWCIIARTPPVTTNDSAKAMNQCILNLDGVDSTEYIFGAGMQTTLQYGQAIVFVKLTQTRSVKLRSGTGQVTYTWRSDYLARGGLFAFRFGD